MSRNLPPIAYPWKQVGNVLFVLAGLSVLSGCLFIEHHPFPREWPPPVSVSQGACAEIGGSYNYKGEDWTGKPIDLNPLTIVFWSRFEREAWPASSFNPTHVVIDQSAVALKVSAWEASKLIAEKKFMQGDSHGYDCTTEGIAVHGQDFPPENMLGYIRDTNTLFKLRDGSLGVKTESVGGGLALGVAPAWVSGTLWFRYRPYRP